MVTGEKLDDTIYHTYMLPIRNESYVTRVQGGDEITERCREIKVKQALRNLRCIIDWLQRERKKIIVK